MNFYIAIPLPDCISGHLATLRSTLSSVDWYDPDTYHITLCHIGKTPNMNLMNLLDLELEKIDNPSFEIIIQGVSHFTSKTYENTLMASILPTSPLLHFKKKIDQTLRKLNFHIPKQRFVPHINLGKGIGLSNQQIANWLYQYNLFKTNPCKIYEFALCSNYPKKSEFYYTIESTYRLT